MTLPNASKDLYLPPILNSIDRGGIPSNGENGKKKKKDTLFEKEYEVFQSPKANTKLFNVSQLGVIKMLM